MISHNFPLYINLQGKECETKKKIEKNECSYSAFLHKLPQNAFQSSEEDIGHDCVSKHSIHDAVSNTSQYSLGHLKPDPKSIEVNGSLSLDFRP